MQVLVGKKRKIIMKIIKSKIIILLLAANN